MFAKFLAAVLGSFLFSAAPARSAITLENRDLRLVIGEDGRALSLIEKASGQECLAPGTKTSAFSLLLDRPNHTDLWVAYPSKRTAYAANRVRQEGDRLVVGFEIVANTAVIRVKTTDDYIGFTLEKVEGKGEGTEVRFLQLPVRNRKNFGGWLNVMWDDAVAINVLATDPYAQIDADAHSGYRVLWASAVGEVKMEGVGAALIATRTPSLLDRIARLEDDFGLPKGAESRRRPEYNYSQMVVGVASGKQGVVTAANVDRYLAFAKQAGFKAIQIYYMTFAQSAGHFVWRPEYPNGMQDLKALAAKITAAGLLPGLHVHYNKATNNDAYVTPAADPRLHLRTMFTLAAPLDEQFDDHPGIRESSRQHHGKRKALPATRRRVGHLRVLYHRSAVSLPRLPQRRTRYPRLSAPKRAEVGAAGCGRLAALHPLRSADRHPGGSGQAHCASL